MFYNRFYTFQFLCLKYREIYACLISFKLFYIMNNVNSIKVVFFLLFLSLQFVYILFFQWVATTYIYANFCILKTIIDSIKNKRLHERTQKIWLCRLKLIAKYRKKLTACTIKVSNGYWIEFTTLGLHLSTLTSIRVQTHTQNYLHHYFNKKWN